MLSTHAKTRLLIEGASVVHEVDHILPAVCYDIIPGMELQLMRHHLRSIVCCLACMALHYPVTATCSRTTLVLCPPLAC